MKSIREEIDAASEFGRHVAREKGLWVYEGESPTAHQTGIAAIHAREDAAAIFYLLASVMKRQQTLQRWAYFIVFLLLCVLTNLK